MTLFAEPYFTEGDAKAVQGMLALLFPNFTFEVRYQGIYGDISTPGKLSYYVVTYKNQWGMRQWINCEDALRHWLYREVGKEQGEQVASLIRNVVEGEDEFTSS